MARVVTNKLVNKLMMTKKPEKLISSALPKCQSWGSSRLPSTCSMSPAPLGKQCNEEVTGG